MPEFAWPSFNQTEGGKPANNSLLPSASVLHPQTPPLLRSGGGRPPVAKQPTIVCRGGAGNHTHWGAEHIPRIFVGLAFRSSRFSVLKTPQSSTCWGSVCESNRNRQSLPQFYFSACISHFYPVSFQLNANCSDLERGCLHTNPIFDRVSFTVPCKIGSF